MESIQQKSQCWPWIWKKSWDYTNITVKTVFFIDGEDNNLMELTQDCKHIFVDEMFADIDQLSLESQNELKIFFS